MVLQDTCLFTGTVRENIRFGKLDATDEEIEAAARLANADSFIRRLPDGYETVLAGNGSSLSQGQRQLLSIARAAVADPPVLILDDPFSALDRKTEEEVFANLRKLAADSIVILLSHRLYLFPEMDQVLWMEDGKVTAGTHEQILEKFPEYARLYEAQADGADAHNTQEGGPDHAEK